MQTDQPDPGTQSPMESLTCQQVTDAMIDYLTGDMPPETARLFHEHLQDCPDCLSFFNTYNSTVRATRSLSYGEVPDEMRNRVRQFLLKSIRR